MALDFTLAAFEDFCQWLTHMPVFTVGDYLARSQPPPTPFVILRIDVDYRETTAVHMARMAERHNLEASFYFRHREGAFDLDAMKAIARLNHEVGYHFETLDTCQGDFQAAADLFLEHVTLLRESGLIIRTVAGHGAPPVAVNYRSNLDLLIHTPGLCERANLLGESTLSIDFSRVAYISDAGWRWRRYNYYRPGVVGKPTSLHATIRDLPRRDAGLYINFHPHQWFAHPATMLYYRVRNRLGTLILPHVRRGSLPKT